MSIVDQGTRKRLRVNSIVYLLLWGIGMASIFMGAPFWAVVLVGVAASCLALRDWRTVRSLARESINPSHPDPNVQALIDGKIDISEYRQSKEQADVA